MNDGQFSDPRICPKSGGNTDAEFSLLTTAHGRDKKRIAHLLNKSEILYFDPDIVRTGTWSMQLRVQFPSRQPSSGSVGSVTYNGNTVNISGKKLSDLGGQVVDADTGAIVYQLRENGAWTPPVRENTQAPELNDGQFSDPRICQD